MEKDGRFNIDIVCEAGLLESLLNHPYETQEGMNDRKQFEDKFVEKSHKMPGVSERKWVSKRVEEEKAKTCQEEDRACATSMKPKEKSNVEKFQNYKDIQTFSASKYKGIIFVKRTNDILRPSINKLPSYVGMRFEHKVTEKVDERNGAEACFNVMNAKINDHSLLYCCKVDCIDQKTEQPGKEDLVEVRTLTTSNDPRATGSQFYGEEARKLWHGCIVSGVSHVYYGVWKGWPPNDVLCKDRGMIEVSTMPCKAKGWIPDTSIKEVRNFLNQLKDNVLDEAPDMWYDITIEPEKEVVFKRITGVVTQSMIRKLDCMSF